jgi:hypothetical protein
MVVTDDYPGLEVLESHALVAPKVTGQLMAPNTATLLR